MRSDVVTLYQGGLYHLYRYKKYTDVRLVFAPEGDIAHFGGDPDNFEFPRFCLDVAFFRVYEDGKPAKTPHYLKWSQNGASADELVFVSGHPGRTSRLNTVAHLELARDVQYPAFLNLMRRREVTLKTWGDRSAENARRASAELMRIQNSRKLLVGMVAGLQDPAVLEQKRAEENSCVPQVGKKPELKEQYGGRLGPRRGVRQGRCAAVPGEPAPRRGGSRAGQPVGVQQHAVQHRPDAGPPRRGEGQAQRRAAARVSGRQPGVAEAAPVLARADLRRPRDGEAGRLARHVRRDARRRRPAGQAGAGRQVAAAPGRPS